ncbi:MAG TPA: hypothetical protein VJN94_15605, partial [Candidatus Binataceae bacterium]|nr:hypothetical protein [Candidatus Binataceae bacterium]
SELLLTRFAGALAGVLLMGVAGCNGFGVGQATNPGSTKPIPQQTSYRIVGEVGTPFRAVISDSRSSWQVFGTIPMTIIIINDSPPDRIMITKLSNDSRLLSLQLIQGLTIRTLDSTVSNFGTAVGALNGKLPAFAPAANPDVRFFVKNPVVGIFTALIEDLTNSNALQARAPAIILFDSPNGGNPGRVDGIFSQVSFAGPFDIDLMINGQLVGNVANGGLLVTLKGG